MLMIGFCYFFKILWQQDSWYFLLGISQTSFNSIVQHLDSTCIKCIWFLMIYYLNIVVCICVNAVCASACYVLYRSRRQLYLLHGLHEIWKSKQVVILVKFLFCFVLFLFVFVSFVFFCFVWMFIWVPVCMCTNSMPDDIRG